MAKKYIDADNLMKSMYHRAFETDGDTMWQSGCWVRYRAIEQVVKEQPTADVRENVRGEWIIHKIKNHQFGGFRECNQCGVWLFLDMPRNSFCPNCGADMRSQDVYGD